MKTNSRGTWFIGWACVLLASVALAEYNTDYIFNGTTTNYGGVFNLPFSSPGTNDTLQILNGGSVSNTTATISPGGSDNHNSALVSGLNSLWYNSGDLVFGAVGGA